MEKRETTAAGIEKQKPTKTLDRDREEKIKDWLPPDRLPSFENVLEGYHLRWVRRELRGESHDANVLSRIRQGYVPVTPEEVDLYDYPTVEDGRFSGTVMSGDLILMKIPDHMADQRTKYYKAQTDRMQRAVDREFEENDSTAMPLSRSVKTQVGVGRPQFQSKDD